MLRKIEERERERGTLGSLNGRVDKKRRSTLIDGEYIKQSTAEIASMIDDLTAVRGSSCYAFDQRKGDSDFLSLLRGKKKGKLEIFRG